MTQHLNSATIPLGITENDPIIYESGQRRCGPPPNWTSDSPGKGCEVFIAKIPKECFEKDLIPVMRQSGEIYMLRLMMETEECHRGFGFCVYMNLDSAKDAVVKLNNYQIRKNWFLGICFSVDNCRLFVGGIPKLKIKYEILKEMSKVTDNVVDIIVYPSAADKNKNRGFAFVEYTDHKSAAVARKKMIVNGIQLWGHNVAVDWAEPERKVDDETMSKVKILYVRNLMLTTSEETIYQIFSKYTKDDEEIIRVKKIGDFAFVHFKNREQAEIVKNKFNGTDLEGSVIEVHFAKPANKLEQQQKLLKKSNASFNNMLPLTKEMRKLSIDSEYNKVISPTAPEINGLFKSYRNAAGRCSIKSKQMFKNNEQQSEIYFSSLVEILTFICQNNDWDTPCFSVQIVPMMLPGNDVTTQIFLAQAYIPGLNCSFPGKIGALTQDEAIINASETALQWMFFNGIQVPYQLGSSNICNNNNSDKDNKLPLDHEPPWTSINYGNPYNPSLSSDLANQYSQPYVQPIFPYNSMVTYCIQPDNYYQSLYIQSNKGIESDKIPISYTINPSK